MNRFFVAFTALFALISLSAFWYGSNTDPIYIPTEDGIGMERGVCYSDCEAVEMHWKALALYQEGRLDEAKSLFSDITAMAPDYVGARLALANIQQHLNEMGDAKANYEYILRLEPGLAQAHAGIGSVEIGLGDFQQAIRSLEKAVEIEPRYGVAHYLLAVSYTRIGETENAILHFRETIKLIPDSMHARLASEWLAELPVN